VKEGHTPNVPKLLFPASFTRVGAQKVVPTLLPAPWTICGEALITLQVKVRVVGLMYFNLKRENLLSDFSPVGVWVRLGLTLIASSRLAQDRSSRHGCDPEGSRHAEQQPTAAHRT
jgi:hypothetical protein